MIAPFSAHESKIFNGYINGFIGDNVTVVGGHKATPLRRCRQLGGYLSSPSMKNIDLIGIH